MSNNLCHANTNTPAPEHAWIQLSDAQRFDIVANAIDAKMMAPLSTIIVLVEARSDGQVIVKLLEAVPANKRGTLLFDLEEFLKESIDPGLVVWLESFGDRSSLRNLRGIEVKS